MSGLVPLPFSGHNLSLRWKLLLTFGLLLLLLFGTYALFSELNLRRQYADKRAAELDMAVDQLRALEGHSRRELLNLAHLVRSLAGVPAAVAEGDAGRLRELFSKQFATLQIDTDLSSAAFFDASGGLLAKEHIFPQGFVLPSRVVSAVERTLASNEAQIVAACQSNCLIHAIAPIAFGGETVGAVTLSRTLDELVIRYSNISQNDIAILAGTGGEPPLRDGLLDERLLREGGNLVAITQRQQSLPLLSQVAEQLGREPPPPQVKEGLWWHSTEYDGGHYELLPLAMPGMGDEDAVMAVIIADVTESQRQMDLVRWQNLAISLVGLAAFSLLMIALTRNPLERLRKIAELLPLLAERRFAEVRDNLNTHQHFFPDELAQLERTTLSLADRLELLEEQIEERNRSLAAKIDELSIERERYELAAAGANDGLWDWRLDANEVYYSPRWRAMVGYSCNESPNTPEEWLARIHPDEQLRVRHELHAHLQGLTNSFQSEHRVYHETSGYRWMLVRGLAVRRDDGTAYRMAGSMSDITDRRRIQAQLEHDALHDVLTGLPNRSLLLERLSHALERAQRSPESFAILFLDLDDFKKINDSLGHISGDQVLIEVSQRLERLVRPVDTVARLGGDEFIILLELISEARQVDQIIERIHEEMAAPIQIGPQEIFVGFSTGITLGGAKLDDNRGKDAADASQPELDIDAETLLRNADTAMYYAKTQNRGDRAFFDWSMHERAVFRLNLEMGLRRALEDNEIELHYQPIVSLPEGRLLGFEALARWPQEQGGWISPGDFIPLAERTGLILPLGRWVIEVAVAKAAELYHRSVNDERQDLTVQLNISGMQLRDPELVYTLHAALERYAVPGDRLKVELTETAIVENAEKALEVMQLIRNTGAKLCIDDFGTGYSSLSQLRDLPFDVLKIDRSFVGRLGRDERDEAIIESILSIAAALDKEVVAEGIETRGQVDALVSLGCRQGQGFYFSRPLTADAV